MPNRYWRGSGTNWSATSSWAETPTGPTNFSVPTAADDVFFDATSGNCTVDVTNRVARSIDFTGYAAVLAMGTFNITVSGNLTFVASQASRVTASTGRLIVNASSTITSNGGTWPVGLQLSTGPFILVDPLTTTGLLTISSCILTGSQINIQGDLTGGNTRGTTNLIFNGAGPSTWIGTVGDPNPVNSAAAPPLIGNNLTIQKTGSMTITGNVGIGAPNLQEMTLTYVSASSFTTTGSSLGIYTIGGLTDRVNLDLAAAGNGWNDLNWWCAFAGQRNTVVRLLSSASFNNVRCKIAPYNPSGSGNAWALTALNPLSELRVRGNWTQEASVPTLSTDSNSRVVMIGSGSVTGSNTFAGTFEIKSPLGIITWVTFLHNTGLMLYTSAGTFNTLGSSLFLRKTTQFSPNGSIWGNIDLNAYNDPNYATFNGQLLSSGSCQNLTIGGIVGVGGTTLTGVGSNLTLTVLNTLANANGNTFGVVNATLIFGGSGTGTWSSTGGAFNMDTRIQKTGGAVVNVTTNIGWVASSRTLELLTSTIFGSTVFTIITIGGGITANIINTSNSTFGDLILGANLQLTINTANLRANNTLTVNGGTPTGTNFLGNRGFVTNNFSSSGAHILTFAQGITYTINGAFTLIGTSPTSRLSLQSSYRKDFTGTINNNVLTLSSGTSLELGTRISQRSGLVPTQLAALYAGPYPYRPVITNNPGLTAFNITPPLTTPIGPTAIALAGGRPAYITLGPAATQNVLWVTTQDIDSFYGNPVFPSSSPPDTAGEPAPNLYRTVNWGLLAAPGLPLARTFCS